MLFRSVVEADEAEETLKRRLLASLQVTHRQVYEQLYQHADVITHSDHGLLKSHYPRLPNRIAWELLSKTSSVERGRLREAGRVPLALAQQTREALQLLEEDQALSGLYWPRQGSEATQRLVVGLLAQVPDWPQAMSLQVRRETDRKSVV